MNTLITVLALCMINFFFFFEFYPPLYCEVYDADDSSQLQ